MDGTNIQQEHRIPQQISAYSFRLVGDMTLKQFSEVAIGVLLALLLYALPIHAVIKWPLIIISFLSGLAFAFFKIEDRPLAKWVGSFFRAVYTPTEFYWKKMDKPPIYFKEEKRDSKSQESSAASKDYIPHSKLDEKENAFLSKISSLTKQPTLGLTGKNGDNKPPMTTNEPKPIEVQVPLSHDIIKSSFQQVAPPSFIKPAQSSDKQTQITIPQSKPIKIKQISNKPHLVVEVKPSTVQPVNPLSGKLTPVQQVLTPQNVPQAQNIQFSPESTLPAPPEIPNTVVGQVIAANGKIIAGAILEIKDPQGRSVRALKTNKAGHFIIVTPLTNGNYQLTTEKEGFLFGSIKFPAEGKIIPPIVVRALAQENNTGNLQQNLQN